MPSSQNDTRKQQIHDALLALQRGDSACASATLKSLIASDPNDPEAWSFYGIAILKQNQQDGLNALSKACQLSPLEPRWHLHLGSCLSDVNQLVAAEQALRKASKLSHNQTSIAITLSQTLQRMGKAKEAVAVLNDTVGRYNEPAAHYQLSQLYAVQHDYPMAIASLNTAYKGQMMSDKDTLLFARWHLNIKQHALAQQHLNILLTRQPYHPDATKLAAQLATWKGDFEYAKTLLKSAFNHHPRDVALMIELLLLPGEHDSQIYDLAISTVDKTTTSSQQAISLLFALSQVADRNGNFDEAWNFAKSANQRASNGLTFDVGLLYQQLDRALAIYQKSDPCETRHDKELIYFLGPPRCGGSLLQNVMAASPSISSVGERGALLPYLMPLLEEPHGLSIFKQQQQDLQNADIAGLVGFDRHAKTYVDKTTHNTHIAGLISRIHPSAKFVEMQKNKHDMMLSIFMRNFSGSFPYSFDLNNISQYLDFQAVAINKWKSAGLLMVTHNHDDFVRQPAPHGRALFNALSFDWDDGFLDPQARRSSVETFSAMQVRSEIKAPAQAKSQQYARFLQHY